jgi:hypothetical protein
MCRPFGAAIPGMSELLVRSENDQLFKRFREVVVLTCSLGVFLGVSYAICNSPFVDIWTRGKIKWPPINDIFLGVSVILTSMQTTHVYFVSITKEIGAMRYIYFAEGISFVLLGIFLAPHFGFVGIITASIFCTLVFSYQYSIRRSGLYFNQKFTKISIMWIFPSIKYALIYIPLAILVWLITMRTNMQTRFILNAFFSLSIGGMLFLAFGLTRDMINQASNKMQQKYSNVYKYYIELFK